MKLVFLLLLIAAGLLSAHAADDRIYRCGNEYTNTVTDAQAKNCKLISGGNITVVPAVRSPAATRVASASGAGGGLWRADRRQFRHLAAGARHGDFGRGVVP